MNIIKHHSLAAVEADLERPFLPLNVVKCAMLSDGEAGAFGLMDLKGLDVGSELMILWHVFVSRLRLPSGRLLYGVVRPSRGVVDTDEFPGDAVHDWGDIERQRVMVPIWVIGMAGVPKVHPALP